VLLLIVGVYIRSLELVVIRSVEIRIRSLELAVIRSVEIRIVSLESIIIDYWNLYLIIGFYI
jgi:hypothetical protein